jgi:hypothetical protein
MLKEENVIILGRAYCLGIFLGELRNAKKTSVKIAVLMAKT